MTRAAHAVDPVPATTMYIARDHTVWISPRLPSGQQRHYHVKLLVALDAHIALTARAHDVRGAAAVIAPDVPHAAQTEGRVLGLLLDPRTDDARRVQRDLLGAHPVAALPSAWLAVHLARLRAFAGRGRDARAAADLVSETVATLTRVEPLDPRDARVTATLAHVRAHAAETIRLRDLARLACLSPDRFAHLFRAEMGVSVRRFLLWSRMRRANQLVLEGASLTAAAHAAGFADAAHFSRTYRQLFGVSPSALLASDTVKLVVSRE